MLTKRAAARTSVERPSLVVQLPTDVLAHGVCVVRARTVPIVRAMLAQPTRATLSAASSPARSALDVRAA